MNGYRSTPAKALLWAALIGTAALASCAGKDAADSRPSPSPAAPAASRLDSAAHLDTATGKPSIAVSILPQAWFVRRIAGGRVEPLVLVGKGQSPHSWEPTPRRLEELSRTTAWVTVGIDFEHALEPKLRALYPKMKIADGSRGVAFRALQAHSHGADSGGAAASGGAAVGRTPAVGGGAAEAGHEGEAAGGRDPHFWLGCEGAKRLAENVRDALVSVDPEGQELFAANCALLLGEIDRLFDALRADLAPLEGSGVLVYHPAFGYFLDEFGIDQEAVETGGKEPTAQNLAALIAEAKADGAKVIFVQAQFPSAAARTIAGAIGGEVAEIDDLAEDWDANLGRMGDALKRAARSAAAGRPAAAGKPAAAGGPDAAGR